VQANPIKPTLKGPGIKPLKHKCDKLLSNFPFKFNLRRYNLGELLLKTGELRARGVDRIQHNALCFLFERSSGNFMQAMAWVNEMLGVGPAGGGWRKEDHVMWVPFNSQDARLRSALYDAASGIHQTVRSTGLIKPNFRTWIAYGHFTHEFPPAQLI